MPAGKNLGLRCARRCPDSRWLASHRRVRAIGTPRRGPERHGQAPDRRTVRSAEPVESGGTARWKHSASGRMAGPGTGRREAPRTSQAAPRTSQAAPRGSRAPHRRMGRDVRRRAARRARPDRDRMGDRRTGQDAHQDKDPTDAPRTGRPERRRAARTAHPGKGQTGDPRTGLTGYGLCTDQIAPPLGLLVGRSKRGRIQFLSNTGWIQFPGTHRRTGSAALLAAIRAGTGPWARRGAVRGDPDLAGHVRRSMRHLAR
jgi:hypothetical protein